MNGVKLTTIEPYGSRNFLLRTTIILHILSGHHLQLMPPLQRFIIKKQYCCRRRIHGQDESNNSNKQQQQQHKQTTTTTHKQKMFCSLTTFSLPLKFNSRLSVTHCVKLRDLISQSLNTTWLGEKLKCQLCETKVKSFLLRESENGAQCLKDVSSTPLVSPSRPISLPFDRVS